MKVDIEVYICKLVKRSHSTKIIKLHKKSKQVILLFIVDETVKLTVCTSLNGLLYIIDNYITQSMKNGKKLCNQTLFAGI